MKVLLAGYNVDTQVMKELRGRRKLATLTPETISAAYARISRSRKTVDDLRAEARQEIAKSRKSNRRIIFEMGHHSVAEHAVFNFDVLGISRRAVEEFENYRLCSYTEKSQRYVTLHGDYVLPEEIKDTPFDDAFQDMIYLQNRRYEELLMELMPSILEKYSGRIDFMKFPGLLENLAKEDARYILSQATQTQIGATVNARNLELMLRRFASHPLAEIRALGVNLYRAVEKIAPSVILFHRANDYDRKTYPELKKYISRSGYQGIGESDKQDIRNKNKQSRGSEYQSNNVELVSYSPDADVQILAALLFRVKKTSYDKCLKIVKKMDLRQRLELFRKACQYMELYDAALREFEYADLTYSLTVSAACFGQLKRHRLVTIVSQSYDPELGITIPESIQAVGKARLFQAAVRKTEELYAKIEKKLPGVGSYILTNAHRKRVLMKVNLRELYHISRLREDPTAQWDIRHLTKDMCRLAQKASPIASHLLGGKTDYPAVYRAFYGRDPKIVEVPEIK
jgi:flavin-dependent thymidylate synthase